MYRNSVGLGHDFQTSGLGLEAGYTTLPIADGGVIERLEEDTELWFTMGGRAVLRGDGAIHADRIEIYTDGIVEPGVDGTGTLTLDGRVDLRETDAHPLPSGEILPEGGLVMDIAGVEQNDRVVMAGVELGGKLEISLVDGFVPQRGDVFEIITLTDQADLISPDPYQVGAFWHVLSPDLGVGVVLQPRYSIDKVELVAVCPADVNMDGIVNVDDIAGFAHDFLGNDATADLTRDGVVNFDDIQRFVDAYLGGCE
ncbi:MAG: GC-type dockerin domain-anchored protein [Phycisphaerales bacterium]